MGQYAPIAPELERRRRYLDAVQREEQGSARKVIGF